jgi:hypothetical protein
MICHVAHEIQNMPRVTLLSPQALVAVVALALWQLLASP